MLSSLDVGGSCVRFPECWSSESILMPFDIYNDSAQQALVVLKQRFSTMKLRLRKSSGFWEAMHELARATFSPVHLNYIHLNGGEISRFLRSYAQKFHVLVDHCFDIFVSKLCDNIFTYYKSWAARYALFLWLDNLCL
ncbi:hypothetical protein CK203_095480 [Vitis vinifera]|uniref:Uncharacterized protein n=1 Tax=Vitis vinifera TaxID=29760 RepID=A0A438EJ65_VITVI|nr:hypothetical protein CK203_095480 [Vitis vinifera]